MKNSLVIGLGFGDEGKGRVSSYLVSQNKNSLVCRFNGGHQAGHTVYFGGHQHIFSSFGSGTLQNRPTFWSKYCTLYPIALKNEYEVLSKIGIHPILYVDPQCLITTPFDVVWNQYQDEKNRHGTVGVGFGTTIQRHEDHFSIFAEDLFNLTVLRTKLDLLRDYYTELYCKNVNGKGWYDLQTKFLEDVEYLKTNNVIHLRNSSILKKYDVIFEGAQGIMLDQKHGFFPHVTRSNTTSKNALELIKENDLDIPEVYYVTRTYQTRHGFGPLSNGKTKPVLINNEQETNVNTGWQGEFRTGILDLDLLNYALIVDNLYSKSLKKNLVITCIDQTITTIDLTGNLIQATENQKELEIDVRDLANYLNFKRKE